jgi:hypothetical protein
MESQGVLTAVTEEPARRAMKWRTHPSTMAAMAAKSAARVTATAMAAAASLLASSLQT